eukprot:g9822.t1
MGTLKKPELGTALCAAAHNGRVGCLKLLLRCKANVNALSTDKRSPLFLAAEGGHLDCVRAILKLRPPNFTSFEEEKLEAEKENIKIQENDPEDQSRVFPFSVDIDLQGDSGKSPLFIAAENGHVAISNALVNAGSAVSLPTSLNKTPLYMASEQGHTEIVRILLTRSTSEDVMKTTNYGTTALFIAQRHGHKAIANMITEFCSNQMKEAVQRSSLHSNGAKVSAKFQREYMAKLQKKYNTLEKERSLLVDAHKQVRGDKAQDLCDDISLVSRKLKQVEEEMRRKNSSNRIGGKKERKSSNTNEAKEDKGKKGNLANAKGKSRKSKKSRRSDTGSNLQMKSRRMRHAYANIESSVLETRGKRASNMRGNREKLNANRKRLAEMERDLKMSEEKNNVWAKPVKTTEDVQEALDKIDKQSKKITDPATEDTLGDSAAVVKRAAASLANADKVLRRARTVEPPNSTPPAEDRRRPSSNGSKIKPAGSNATVLSNETHSKKQDKPNPPQGPSTPRRSHDRLREAQEWSKKLKARHVPPPPPLSPPFEPIEVPARKSQSKMRVSNSEAETEEIPREKAGLPSSEKRIRKKEKFVKDAWSCLAGRSLSSIHRCLLRFSKSTSGFLISKPLLAYIYGAAPIEVTAVFDLLAPERDDGIISQDNEERDSKNTDDTSIDAFECFVATSLLASGPLEDRLRFCFGLFDREGTNKLSKRHVGMLIRCCLTSVSKLHIRNSSIKYLDTLSSSKGVSDLVDSAFNRVAKKRSKKKKLMKEYEPDAISAKQFARWALDSKAPAPFVQALTDLIDMTLQPESVCDDSKDKWMNLTRKD